MNKRTIVKMMILFSVLYLTECRGNRCGHPVENENTVNSTDARSRDFGVKTRRRQQGRGRQVKLDQEEITLSEEVKNQIDLKTVQVEEQPIASTLEAMGKVLAPNDRKAIVGHAFTARIVKLHVSVGDWVKPSQPLVTLESEEVGDAKADFFKARTDYDLAKINFNREERLYQKDIGAKKDYLEMRARFQIARANLDSSEKKLLILGFSKEQINGLIDQHNITPLITIRAPISGRVIRNNAVLGAMIDQSTEIMVIMDPTVLWIDAEIFEKDLSKISINQKVQIGVPAFPDETFCGRIHYIGDVVNPTTRTITVRTQVENLGFRLKPGMFADISILMEKKNQALTVPVSAILDDGPDRIVFIQRGGHYIMRRVAVGAKHNNHVEILEGLEAGDRVVTRGNYQLRSRLKEAGIKQAHVH